jgi:hypothetical protein
MNAQAIIEDYVNKVAAHLPRRMRNDVGLELRTLLTEQLRAAAHESERSPDSEMAMEVLHRFGRPDEVASRYATPGFQLIQPEYAPTFVTLAAICVAIQWAVTLPLVFSSHMTFGGWWLRWGFSALSWVGALVVYFGIGSWLQRRFPAEPGSSSRPWTHLIVWLPFPRGWRPGEPEATEWRAARNAAPDRADGREARAAGGRGAQRGVAETDRSHPIRPMVRVRRVAVLDGIRMADFCQSHNQCSFQGMAAGIPARQLDPAPRMDPTGSHSGARIEESRFSAKRRKPLIPNRVTTVH